MTWYLVMTWYHVKIWYRVITWCHVKKWYHVMTWFHVMTWYLRNPGPWTGSPSELMSSYFGDLKLHPTSTILNYLSALKQFDFNDFAGCYRFSRMLGVKNALWGLTLGSCSSTGRNVCETGRDLKTRWPIVPHNFLLFVGNLIFPQEALCCRGPGGLVSCRAFSPQHPEKSIDQARDMTWLSCNKMILCRVVTWYHVMTRYHFLTWYHLVTW